MKRFVLLFAIVATVAVAGNAQKIAYVDTDYILENIPAYQEAQKELDATSLRWQKEIEAKYAEIDQLYKAFQAEKVLLTEEMAVKRENEIIDKEKEAKEFQKQKFGVDGELFKKRQQLIKPIPDDVYNAIKSVADASSYAVIFDKAAQSNILYSDPKYDRSDAVLKKLGYTPGKE